MRRRPWVPASGVNANSNANGAGLQAAPSGVFTQMTRGQNFDARPGTDWTVFMLSIGRHVKFDARASKF